MCFGRRATADCVVVVPQRGGYSLVRMGCSQCFVSSVKCIVVFSSREGSVLGFETVGVRSRDLNLD